MIDGEGMARVGAWGQLGTLALAVGCWVVGASSAMVATAFGYLAVTGVGIGGMIDAEDIPNAGPLIYPFLVPGFVPLYYFGVQY